MIAPSEFNAISAAGLGSVTLALVEKFNDDNAKLPYYHRRFLTPKFSLDGTWNTLQINNRAIVADIVSLDSSIPLKTRASSGKVSGELPKIGTKRSMNETELRQLRLMIAAGYDLLTIQASFFNDTVSVYESVLEQWEALFLEALSSGLVVTNANYNTGTGIRVDFGYQAANSFNPPIVWGGAGYKPVTDLSTMSDAAMNNGTPISLFLMPRAQLNQLLSSDEAKNIFANSQGLATGAFKPTLEQFNSAVQTSYGWSVEAITRTVTYEKDGAQVTVNPWKAGSVIGLSNENVGSLVYSDVEEATAQVGGVDYAFGENGMLIKQYRLVEPSLKQMTASESVSMPVISEVNSIYKLDTLIASA